MNHNVILGVPGSLDIGVQNHVGNLWKGHENILHLRLPSHSVAPPFAVIGSSAMTDFLLPAPISAKCRVMKFSG
jgi:hypothetical protein